MEFPVIRLYVFINGPQWSLALAKAPNLPRPPQPNMFFVNSYRDERDARDAMSTLGLLLLQKTAENTTLDIRYIVISAIDEFHRSRAA